MKRDIMEVLGEFFGDDEEALQKFAEDVDNVNRTIKDEGLIHRAKAAKAAATEDPAEEEDEEVPATEEDSAALTILELDDEAISQVKEQIFASPEFISIQQSLDKANAALEIVVKAQEASAKETAELKKSNSTLAKRVAELSKSETEKKQTWAEDLPSRRRQPATYRASEQEVDDEDEGEGEEVSEMKEAAERTLSRLPTYG